MTIHIHLNHERNSNAIALQFKINIKMKSDPQFNVQCCHCQCCYNICSHTIKQWRRQRRWRKKKNRNKKNDSNNKSQIHGAHFSIYFHSHGWKRFRNSKHRTECNFIHQKKLYIYIFFSISISHREEKKNGEKEEANVTHKAWLVSRISRAAPAKTQPNEKKTIYSAPANKSTDSVANAKCWWWDRKP